VLADGSNLLIIRAQQSASKMPGTESGACRVFQKRFSRQHAGILSGYTF
jgi:hypothetical protein